MNLHPSASPPFHPYRRSHPRSTSSLPDMSPATVPDTAGFLVREVSPEWENDLPQREPTDDAVDGPQGAAELSAEATDGSAESEADRIHRLLVEAGLRSEVARVLLTIEPPLRVSGPWAHLVPESPETPLTAEQSDAVEELTTTVRNVSAQIAAGEYRRMILVAAFDRAEAWRRQGHRSCAEWLSWQTGLDLGAARQRVNTAHALVQLPKVGEAMARGALSYSKVRALGRLADELKSEEAQATWVEVAEQLPAHELERRVGHARQLLEHDETELEERRIGRRSLSIAPDEGGMYRIRGRLTADVAHLLMKALEAAGDVLHHADGRDWSPKGDGYSVHIETATPEQRRADALWLLAQRVMEVGFPTDEEIARELAELEAEQARENTEASELEAEQSGKLSAESEDARSDSGAGGEGREDEGGEGERAAPRSPRARRWAAQTTAERYRVIVRVDEGALRDGAGCVPGEEPGLRAESSFLDGTRMTPETARRLACCSPVTRLTCADDLVQAMESRSRRVPQRLWTALLLRDRGCRFPGCRCRMNLVPHHIVHRADGGPTDYWNLVLLCPVHHRGVHEGGFTIKLRRSGEVHVTDRIGMPIPPCAPPPMLPDPIELLRKRWEAECRSQGLDPETPRPRREVRSAQDLFPGLMERAMEALVEEPRDAVEELRAVDEEEPWPGGEG